MKKLIFIIALIAIVLNPLTAGGIDISVELTKTPYKWGGKNGNRFEYIIGETSDEYLALRATVFFTYDFKIARYEKETMNLIEVKPLFPKDYIKKGGIKPNYTWGINQFKEQIYFLFGYTDQKNDNVSIYHQKLNDDGSFDGDPDRLVEAPFLKGKAGWFSGTFSHDSSKFLSVYGVPTKNKNKENQAYAFHVFDINSNMSLLAEKEIELPYVDKDVVLISYDVDNEANVYALVKIFEKKDKGKKDANYLFKVFGFPKESDEIIEFDFTNNLGIDVYINNIILKVKNGVVYCSGFWGKKTARNISGVFSLRLDAETGGELAKDFYEFPKEFIDEFYTDKQVDKADKKGKELEIPTMVLDQFIVNDDGSAYIIGEQYYTYTVCYSTGNGGMRCVTYYVHNDIIASKIGPDGEILWACKIPKKSVLANSSGHLSYHMFKKGEDLYFIYYDNQENFDLVDPKKYDRVPNFGKKMDLVCTKINEEGEREKTLIYNYGDAGWNQLRVTPIQFQNLNGSEVLGQGFVKGKKEVLCRFTIR